MQSASVNYIQAASGAGGQWAEPSLMVDWLQNGYNGTLDNLSNQAGGWSVSHHLDDGYPSSVTLISESPVPTLTADLGPPPTYLTGGVPMQVATYYSPYNTASPIYGIDRDVPPVKLAHGVVGAAGPERITIFTGQMADIPIKNGKATLAAVSATRLRLAKLVQPPAVNGLYQGANATWPISNALASCGVYASPPPQTGARWWAPMHGSCRSFIPARNLDASDIYVAVNQQVGPNRPDRIRTCDGPFVAAMENGCNDSFVQRVVKGSAVTTVEFEEGGPGVLLQNSVAKFESWVRGDATNLNFFPGGSGAITSLYRLTITDSVTNCNADVLIRTDRKLQATFSDTSGHTASVISTNPLPTDGAWHFVGFAWDIANKKVWINLDGTVQSATNASIVIGNFGTTEFLLAVNPTFTLPCAEVQVTGGVTGSVVSPDVGPWLRDIPFTAQARVNTSAMELANVADPTPMDAWAYISRYAQAELASMRIDELDIFNYLTCGWWVKAAQQAVVDTYSTELNAGPVDVNVDPTKIRNEVVVSFGEVLSPNIFQTVFSNSEAIAIPPGTTTLILPLTKATFELRGVAFQSIMSFDTVQPLNVNSISFNGLSDGTGTYFGQDLVIPQVVSWTPGEAVVEIENFFSATVYMANDKNWPSITLAGKAQEEGSASVTESDPTSIAVRGERSLDVSSDVLQTRVNARRLARRLLMGLRKPQPEADPVPLFGEARRQPGDLITFADPTMTQVSGLWRAQSIKHDYAVSEGDVSYTNEAIVRPTRDILIIGRGTIGNTLIGPTQ